MVETYKLEGTVTAEFIAVADRLQEVMSKRRGYNYVEKEGYAEIYSDLATICIKSDNGTTAFSFLDPLSMDDVILISCLLQELQKAFSPDFSLQDIKVTYMFDTADYAYAMRVLRLADAWYDYNQFFVATRHNLTEIHPYPDDLIDLIYHKSKEKVRILALYKLKVQNPIVDVYDILFNNTPSITVFIGSDLEMFEILIRYFKRFLEYASEITAHKNEGTSKNVRLLFRTKVLALFRHDKDNRDVRLRLNRIVAENEGLLQK